MVGRLTDKVALVTGAARGQGRSHALRLAREGADVVLVDLCDNIPTCNYPLATAEDLDETARMVQSLQRRVVVYRADVCDRSELETVVEIGFRELGGLDVVVANARIAPQCNDTAVSTFFDTFDVDFLGVVNTFAAAIPRLRPGASLIATGSVSATRRPTGDVGSDSGGAAYRLALSLIEQYVGVLASQLAPQGFRVNAVQPSSGIGATIRTEQMSQLVRRVLDESTQSAVLRTLTTASQTVPVPRIDPTEMSSTVAFLASDESRHVTGRLLTPRTGVALN